MHRRTRFRFAGLASAQRCGEMSTSCTATLLAPLRRAMIALTVGAALASSVGDAGAEVPAACVPEPTAGVASTADDSAALSAVWDAYVSALRRGDLAGLQQVFRADGVFSALQPDEDGRATVLRSRPFAEALPRWASTPDPAASARLHRTFACARMGVVEGELTFGGSRFFDVLTLYRFDDGWRIVGKATQRRP